MDVVVSFETIEHLSAPLEFLQECRRVLKNRGTLICSTPNHRVYSWHGANPFHVREYSSREFVSILRGLFSEVSAYGQEEKLYPLFVPKMLVLRALRKLGLESDIRRLIRGQGHTRESKFEFDLLSEGARIWVQSTQGVVAFVSPCMSLLLQENSRTVECDPCRCSIS